MKRIAFVILVMLIIVGSVFAVRVACSTCNGSGKIACYYCDGAGRLPAGSIQGNPITMVCTICIGSGKQDCKICDGRGYQEE